MSRGSNFKRNSKYTRVIGRAESSGEVLPEWHRDAACAEVTMAEPEMGSAWIDREHEQAARAKEICATCPVRRLCLQDALEDIHAQGVRAGVDWDGGQVDRDGAKEIRQKFRILVPERRIYGGAANAFLNKSL